MVFIRGMRMKKIINRDIQNKMGTKKIITKIMMQKHIKQTIKIRVNMQSLMKKLKIQKLVILRKNIKIHNRQRLKI